MIKKISGLAWLHNSKPFHFLVFTILFVAFTSPVACIKGDPRTPGSKIYPNDVAVAWMNLQLRLTKGTPGFNSPVSSRSYGYVGLTLYESIAEGMSGHRSIAPQLNGNLVLPAFDEKKNYYWPASANAALAFISKNLFAKTPAPLAMAIDSLQANFHNKFAARVNAEVLQQSEDYGRSIAMAIFEWSKTDGGHEAYDNITDPTYVPPKGPGLWEPTSPGAPHPLHPRWGNRRTFIPGLVAAIVVDPPIAYSEDTNSPFYKSVKEVYDISLSLSASDSTTARFWADLPTNYNTPAHATNIVTQLVVKENLNLAEAALLYCKHGIAINDGLISCFKAKYTYNLVRPLTYIRKVIGQASWNTVVPTPSFPECTSAHAVMSQASALVLEDKFGNNYSFTDNTYTNLYGKRNFSSFDDCAYEAAQSRVLGGIHYQFSADMGIKQGEKVGKLVNQLGFHKKE